MKMRKTLFFFIAVAIIITSAAGFSNAAMVVPTSTTSTPSEPDPASVKSALGEFKSLSKKRKKKPYKGCEKRNQSL